MKFEQANASLEEMSMKLKNQGNPEVMQKERYLRPYKEENKPKEESMEIKNVTEKCDGFLHSYNFV